MADFTLDTINPTRMLFGYLGNRRSIDLNDNQRIEDNERLDKDYDGKVSEEEAWVFVRENRANFSVRIIVENIFSAPFPEEVKLQGQTLEQLHQLYKKHKVPLPGSLLERMAALLKSPDFEVKYRVLWIFLDTGISKGEVLMPYYSVIEALAQEGSGPMAEAAKEVLGNLDQWKEQSVALPEFAATRRIYEFFGLMEGGIRNNKRCIDVNQNKKCDEEEVIDEDDNNTVSEDEAWRFLAHFAYDYRFQDFINGPFAAAVAEDLKTLPADKKTALRERIDQLAKAVGNRSVFKKRLIQIMAAYAGDNQSYWRERAEERASSEIKEPPKKERTKKQASEESPFTFWDLWSLEFEIPFMFPLYETQMHSASFPWHSSDEFLPLYKPVKGKQRELRFEDSSGGGIQAKVFLYSILGGGIGFQVFSNSTPMDSEEKKAELEGEKTVIEQRQEYASLLFPVELRLPLLSSSDGNIQLAPFGRWTKVYFGEQSLVVTRGLSAYSEGKEHILATFQKDWEIDFGLNIILGNYFSLKMAGRYSKLGLKENMLPEGATFKFNEWFFGFSLGLFINQEGKLSLFTLGGE